MIHRLIMLDYPEQVIAGIVESTVVVRNFKPGYCGPTAFGGDGHLWATAVLIDVMERPQAKGKDGEAPPAAWFWKFTNVQWLPAKVRATIDDKLWERDGQIEIPMVPAHAQKMLDMLLFTDEPNQCAFCGAEIDAFGRCKARCFPIAQRCIGRAKMRCALCGELCALCPDEDKKPQLFDPRTGNAHVCAT